MGIIGLAIVVWAVAMAAWFAVSKYFKSADVDKIKQRLTGSVKAKKPVKGEKVGPQSIMQAEQTSDNKFANAIVEKYRLGPKMALFLEQAGLKWTPARLVHLCIVAFGVGFVAGWILLPMHLLAIPVGMMSGAGPLVYVWFQRRTRLKKFEEIFPETLEFISRSMRAGHAFSVSLEMIHREFAEPVSGEFRRTFEEHNLGLPLDVALQKLAERIP